MVFIERQFKGEKYYYYLTQTIRLEDNKFKKVRYFAEVSDKKLSKSQEDALKVLYGDEFESVLDEYKPASIKTDYDVNNFFEDEWEVYSKEDIKEIAQKAVKSKFTFAHLQEVYFNSVFIAINKGRETPDKDDVKASLKQVVKEKQHIDHDFSAKRRDITEDYDDYERE